ncbi:protein kinase [Lujinxingia vulgaris]|uniref:Protein kinase n=1 Tax=Lujinxingia vulgaris TaxID=2600176 RepID=A0A5C6X776_9DELT|nr:protein kinase [Lujinxingia vulgaris]TXD37693.1 protein kinase [Lujinxingia vulgaris]
MLCHQCGSPVEDDAQKCPNCGVGLRRARRKTKTSAEGLRRMTMELKALDVQGLYFPPGEVIAERFKLEERIGEGSFGQVYRAEDTLIETDVAIKLFATDVLRTPIDEERFLKATRAARALTQRNVVRLHDSGVHKGHPWVSMQHLEGLSLDKVLKMRGERGQRFELDELEPIVQQITLALQHIGRDYPHGNLKPQNIILMPDLLKVTDTYVLAALAPEVFAGRADESPFVAPELRSASVVPDARVDVYSVGALIKAMVFGQEHTPGSYQGESPLEAVDALVRRAMAFDRSERYASVEALSEDFSTIVDTGLRLANAGVVSEAPAAPPAPPAPPVAPPGAPGADPLAQETAMDIGEPLEDDIATVEVKRSSQKPELIDMLPTNEVDRDAHPTSAKAPVAPAPPVAPPAEPEAPLADDAPELEERPPVVPTQVAAAPKAKTTPAKRESKSPAGLIAAVVLVVVLIAVFALNRGGEDDAAEAPEPVAQANEVSEEPQEEVASSPEADAGADVDEAALQAEREAFGALLAQAEPQTEKAVSDATQAAQTRAEELAEEARAAEAAATEAAPAAVAQADSSASSASAGNGSSASQPAQTGGATRPTQQAPRPAANATDCPPGMLLVRANAGNFCVDAYEYPGRGRTPKNRVTWFEARRLCAQDNKRLCTMSEWRSACGGAAFPYGNSYDADRCNTADEDGFERSLAAAGSFAQCRSRSGAFDMTGNVFEWVEEQRVAGGGYDSESDVASCRYSSPKAPGSGEANIGFRCCASPE